MPVMPVMPVMRAAAAAGEVGLGVGRVGVGERAGGRDADQVGALEAAQCAGEFLAGAGLTSQAGQPDQHRGRDGGGGGELGVALEFPGDAGKRFGAEVELEEPRERARRPVPKAVSACAVYP